MVSIVLQAVLLLTYREASHMRSLTVVTCLVLLLANGRTRLLVYDMPTANFLQDLRRNEGSLLGPQRFRPFCSRNVEMVFGRVR